MRIIVSLVVTWLAVLLAVLVVTVAPEVPGFIRAHWPWVVFAVVVFIVPYRALGRA